MNVFKFRPIVLVILILSMLAVASLSTQTVDANKTSGTQNVEELLGGRYLGKPNLYTACRSRWSGFTGRFSYVWYLNRYSCQVRYWWGKRFETMDINEACWRTYGRPAHGQGRVPYSVNCYR